MKEIYRVTVCSDKLRRCESVYFTDKTLAERFILSFSHIIHKQKMDLKIMDPKPEAEILYTLGEDLIPAIRQVNKEFKQEIIDNKSTESAFENRCPKCGNMAVIKKPGSRRTECIKCGHIFNGRIG